MRNFITIILLVSLSTPHLAAQEKPAWTVNAASLEMTKLNKQLTDAYLNEDVKLLHQMLADDHIHNNVFGVALTKQQFLRDIETGILQFEKYETPEIQWYIGQDTAIATGRIEAKAIRDGRVVPATSFIFTRVFVKRGGEWKVLLFHNTMAKQR